MLAILPTPPFTYRPQYARLAPFGLSLHRLGSEGAFRRVPALRHTTVSRVPPSLYHSTITTRSFQPVATAGMRSAGRSDHCTHAHTVTRSPCPAHPMGCGPYAATG